MPAATESTVLPTGVAAPAKSAKMEKTTASKPAVDIIDIRTAAVELNLKQEIHDLFKPNQGPRTLPTLLLYDERGLQIFEEVRIDPDNRRQKTPLNLTPPDHIPGGVLPDQ